MAIPFLFSGEYREVDAVTSRLRPHFAGRFAEQGLELVAMTEVGFIYTMSTAPIASVADLQKAVCWAPTGDPLSEAFLRELGIAPVQLAIPDVLSSLQTGLINTVFNSLYGSIVLQWFTKATAVTDVPFGYAYGAFLLDRKKFTELPPGHAEILRRAAEKHFTVLLAETRKSNEEARQVLGERGVSFIPEPAGAVAAFQRHRDASLEKLQGTAFSAAIYQEARAALEEFRNQPAPGAGK